MISVEIPERLLPGKCVSFLILYVLQMFHHFAEIAPSSSRQTALEVAIITFN